jgi:hypothetical protein
MIRPARVAVAVAAVALAAACGTTVDTASSGGQLGAPVTGASPGSGLGGVAAPSTTGGAVPVVPGASSTTTTTGGDGAPQVTVASGPDLPTSGSGPSANLSPVKVGMIYTYNDDAAASAGIDNGNTFTSRATFDAMVKAYNARGGVAGRRIVPVAVELNSNSTALQADLQAACDRFTQDEHVAVVLSAIGLFSEAFSQCLGKAGVPQLTGDYALGDNPAIAAVPTLLGVATLTVDDRESAVLRQMTSIRRITSKDTLGVIVEGCPYNTRAYTRTVEPLAKKLGVPVAQRFDTRCFESIGDLGGLGTDMQNAVLRFQTNGVTHVTFVSGSVEGNAMFLFATAAQTQGYHPTYLLTSAAIPAVQETNTPKEQLAKAYGVGWIPSIDASHSALTGAAATRCVKDLHDAAGITPQSAADRFFATSTCDVFGLYDAALRRNRGDAAARSELAAVGSLGTGFASAAGFGGATDFSGGRRTGAAQARLFAWSAPCGCFAYTGQPFSVVSR